MKIAIIGATGQAGSLICKEALLRGFEVTGIVRNPQKLTFEIPVIKKDLYDLTAADLSPFEVVIDAFRAPSGHEEMHETSLAHLISILTGTTTRLLVVGGSSSLFVKDQVPMIETAPSDAPYYPTAYHMYQAFKELKNSHDLNWTYLSPAAYFNPTGKRYGSYQFTGETLGVNSQGKSEISMADYAIAMMDIAEKNLYENQHVGVVEN